MNKSEIFNIILAFFTAIALGLSIWSFMTKCKDKSPFGDILSAEDCANSPLAQQGELAIENCERTMDTLSDNIGAQGWGQPANRGIHDSSGAYAGAFGDPNIISGNYGNYGNWTNWTNWKNMAGVNSRYREREERNDDREDD